MIFYWKGGTVEVLTGRYTDMKTFVDAALSAEGKKVGRSIYIDFDPISDATADNIQEATGIDVHGFGHALDGSAVVHILNRHGKSGTALKDFPNQIPLYSRAEKITRRTLKKRFLHMS